MLARLDGVQILKVDVEGSEPFGKSAGVVELSR
jgi:hypothetical protein